MCSVLFPDFQRTQRNILINHTIILTKPYLRSQRDFLTSLYSSRFIFVCNIPLVFYPSCKMCLTKKAVGDCRIHRRFHLFSSIFSFHVLLVLLNFELPNGSSGPVSGGLSSMAFFLFFTKHGAMSMRLAQLLRMCFIHLSI